jgi:16S rRNA (uracil1498-N3)-methyltransferase
MPGLNTFVKRLEMQIFYSSDIDGKEFILDRNESKHLVRVLRMKKGSPVKLTDGKGNLYDGIISEPDPAGCIIEITNTIRNFEKKDYRLHIAISPLKNPERFEWFIEKSVEIGIDEITPLLCKNTEKTGVKTERINNLVISAMKQSLKAWKTKINQPVSFGDFIYSRPSDKCLIAHCNNEINRVRIADAYSHGENALVLIGPEGDFTEEEIKNAIKSGFLSIHLGNSRLRTETAGLAACHSIYLINQ